VGALVSLLTGGGGGGANALSDTGPPTVDALAHEIGAIHRFDGVRAKFIRGGAAVKASAARAYPKSSSPTAPARKRGGGGVPVYRDPALRLSGTVVAAARIG
jgi:hypothetical protein